jgi:two-component sensor histidine kinase
MATAALVVADDGGGGGRTLEPGDHAKPTLGAGIIRGLAAQLKGAIEVRRENGTRSEIRVPVPVLT